MIVACGRADLLRLLASGNDALIDQSAQFLGYSPLDLPVTVVKAGAGAATMGLAEHEPAGATAAQPRPKAEFLQVVRRTYAEQQEMVVATSEIAPWDEPSRGSTFTKPEPTPLVPWPTLWRRLRPLLSREIVTAETDVPRLVEQISQAEPINQLPRLKLRRFASRVRLLVDRSRRLVPFWDDQDQLSTALARWTVRHGKRPRICAEGTQPDELLQRDPLDLLLNDASAAIDPDTIDQQEDYRGVLVLMLGDLGAYGGVEDREFWAQSGSLLTRAGADLRALVPCPAWRADARLTQQWQAMTWDARERDCIPLTQAELLARAERLLTLVSSAVRVEPGLLRAARALLPPNTTDTGTEADACAHAAILSQSSDALTLDADKARVWRREFVKLPRNLHEGLVRLLRHWHGWLPEEILKEELLALAEQLPRLPDVEPVISDEEVRSLRNFFLSIARAFDREHRKHEALDESVSGWFRRFDGRLPESIWQHPELGEALRRAWAIVHRNDASPRTPPGLDPNALRGLFPAESYAPRLHRLWQVGNRIEVLPAEVSSVGGPPIPRPGTAQCPVGSALAEIVIAEPRLAVASAHQSGKWHSLLPSGSTSIELPDANELTITSDREQLSIGAVDKPPWATRAGRDAYGLFAEFEFRGVAQRMRWIPPGRFKMGSPESEAERVAERERQHEVELTEGYWLADTACTQQLWQAVMGSNPSHFKVDADGKSAQWPVENVSWDDCQKFCEKLNEEFRHGHAHGHAFRLPTEAEWEYSCRAGTETPFSFGENITPELANYHGEYPYAGGAKGKYRGKTVPVGSLPANPWGIHEMHGNVWEWCSDWYAPYDVEAGKDPKGPETGESRVLRGGSWFNFARLTRSAYRRRVEPGLRNVDFGFRLARGQ